jgi:hypothetical protein
MKAPIVLVMPQDFRPEGFEQENSPSNQWRDESFTEN